ncbi:MAG: hypothetical protein LIO40_04890, partial [Ruminococcus sp.]|nr:hypothetical protein [Ruminococcus sp.]
MEPKYYKDFFNVPVKYEPTMTREAINETADRWMDFYPHTTFIELLKTLFDESKSVWITGNFGVGKSNATLVIQKLFMDDMSRVDKWFEDNENVITNSAVLRDELAEAREEGTLVIYDYNASGINPHEEFLVRLEKGVLAALDEYGLFAPTKSNLDAVIDRLYREGENFFKTRDSMLGEMKSLKADICSVDELAALLRKDDSAETPAHYLEDVEKVLHKDNIYLDIDVSSFRKWITDILRVNKLRRIIYIFDEFTDFVDENSGQLKTFEEVTEAPDVNHFYLVPVTHQEPTAFHGENAPGAKRTRDRFYFRNLSMPNDIAFQLAARAMKPVKDPEIAIKWDAAKDQLWSSVRSVVDRFTDPPTSAAYVGRQSFFGILPLQPMTAFMLKFLAEHARSNQRSIFEYLKGSADGHEFQDFIANGGPDIAGAQLLTPDYLWKYFMERSDSGQSREITDIKLEYSRIVEREYKNYSDTADEIRILKTVMLFSLLSRLAPDGHERLAPTVENVELSFRGDGTIMDVRGILRDMSENKHCFSIVDGKIDLYTTTVGGDDLKKKVDELKGQFYELIAPECKSAFEEHTKKARADFSSERFDIRVSDASHTTLTNITSATRDKYSTGISKDNASICLWFVIAKDKSEQNMVSSRVESMLNQLHDHRIIMFSFPENTFCKDNANRWNEYVTLYAQYLLENSTKAKDQIKKSYTGITDKWIAALKGANTAIEVRYYDKNQSICEKYQWPQLKLFLQRYVERTLDACPDILTDQITAFKNQGLKQWALAGIRFSGIKPQSQLIDHLKSNGVSLDDEWFDSHPEHIFSKIRKLLEKKYTNTVGRGTELSLRKVYIELQRAPYGLRYNCLSAFTLGFCSAWMIRKNCQWTNGQLTCPLDEETLAEIIESTVSDKTAKEKLICRLSKEDLTFAKYIGCMVGMPPLETNPKPLHTLELGSIKIQNTSMKVPLWILAEYIEKNNPQHKNAANVLNNLCTALRISSKGNSEEKTGAIAEIGRKIVEEPEIIEIVSRYTTRETYVRAFQIYVDSVKPKLRALAEKIGEQCHQYCDAILDDA